MNRAFATGMMIGVLVAGTGCASAGATPRATRAPEGTGLASRDDAPSPCRAVGPARAVATHAFVPAGVQASAEGGGFTVRFAHRKADCVAASLGREGLPTGEAVSECPGGESPAVATSGGETMLAKEAAGAGRPGVSLDVLVYDTSPGALLGFVAGGPPRVVETSFDAGSRPPSRPGLVGLPGEQFLLTWVDGGIETHGAHAQVVAGWGRPVGPAFDLSPGDVSVIGRPTAAIGPDGAGVVAFLASNGHGFDVMATPVACEAR